MLGNAKPLADWLGAALLEDESRPVELRKGVLCRGTFTYREHNDGGVAAETLACGDGDRPAQLVLHAVTALVSGGEQVLVFVPDKPASRKCTELVAAQLALPPGL